MGNPLVAQAQSSTTWHSGINLLDDASSTYDGISSGSWIEGGLGAFGTGMDLLTIAMNPVGTLISYGLNFLIEHVKSLQDALNQLAGDADQITAYAKTWGNVSSAVGKAAKDLSDAVTKDTANWTGQAGDAYRANITNRINSMTAAATCANAIGSAVQIVGVITGAVRGLVRDMVTQAVGDFIQDALEEVFSLGLGTPVVVAQVVEQVSEWIDKITGVIKKLINSVEALRPLMSKLEEIWGAIQKVMNALHGHADDEPHLSTGNDSTTPSAAREPSTSGDDATTPSSASSTDSTTPSSTGETTPSSTGEPAPTDTTPSDGTTTGPDDSTTPSAAEPRSSTDDTNIDNTEPPKNSKTSDSTAATDDPIDLTTGRVFLDQTDVALASALSLVLTRSHRSDQRVGRWFGPAWCSTVDQRIEVVDDAVHFAAEDGMLLSYPLPGGTGSVLPVHGTPWPLAPTADGGYTITNRQAGRTLHFAPTGMAKLPISAITDRNGNRVDFLHDEGGVLREIRHSGGYQVAVDVEHGLITALRLVVEGQDTDDRNGIVLKRYRYDDARNLVEVTNSSGRPTQFGYDTAGRLVHWVDTNGMWYRYDYDAEGRCVQARGRDGFLDCALEYGDRTVRRTNSLGDTIVYHLNDQFQIVREVNPLGQATEFAWDGNHRLLAQTDPLGRTIRHTYDDAGNLVTTTRADGSQVRAEYNALGLPVTITAPDGAVWRQRFDERGNLLGTLDATGSATTFSYDERGNLATVTDALGNTSRTTNNSAGLPVTITDPTGATTRVSRDRCGRVAEIIDPLGGLTRFSWTVEGRMLSRTLPDGATEHWAYDGEGNSVRHMDALGQVTNTQINHFDLPVATTGPDNTRVEYGYDTELRLRSVTNGAGLTWHYTYDGAGNLVQESDYNGRVVDYAYDGAGRLVERVNGAAQTTRYDYDALDNIVEQRVGDVVNQFRYDPAGRLVQATNPDADLVLRRDPLGRVIAEIVNGREISSGYDPLGRRIRRATPSGARSDWDYGTGERPVALHIAGQTVRFDYDGAGQEVRREFGALTLTQTWDANHRLRTQALTVRDRSGSAGPGPVPAATVSRNAELIQRRAYWYRLDGELAGVADQLAGTREFDLDAAGRVTAVRGPDDVERYAYDRSGNLAAANWPDRGDGAEPDRVLGRRAYAGTLLRSAGNAHYEHDRQGRLVVKRTRSLSGQVRVWRYTWDADDNLTTVTTPDGQWWRYRYDPLGRRIAKQRLHTDGTTVLDQVDFAWDGSALAETVHNVRTSAGARTSQVTTWDWEPGGVRPVSQRDQVIDADTPQSVIDQRFYGIITDVVGTPTQLVEPSGRIAWQQRTSLWGALLARANRTAAQCPLRFPGQYHDTETGLNYNYLRYYDPSTAQYLSPDPLGLLAALNPHAYVANPTTWSDPLGLVPCDAEGQIDYGKGMSKAVQEQRLADGNKGNNYAAATYRYKDADGNWQYSDPVVERSAGKLHAEQRLLAKLQGMGVDPQDITHLYSELQPCQSRCGPLLDRTLSSTAKITWSWPWTTSAEGAASRAARDEAVKALFGK